VISMPIPYAVASISSALVVPGLTEIVGRIMGKVQVPDRSDHAPMGTIDEVLPNGGSLRSPSRYRVSAHPPQEDGLILVPGCRSLRLLLLTGGAGAGPGTARPA